MAELGEPWHDADAEYAALTELLVPAAHGRYEQALDAWDATETKALGFLAIAVAIIAGLTTGAYSWGPHPPVRLRSRVDPSHRLARVAWRRDENSEEEAPTQEAPGYVPISGQPGPHDVCQEGLRRDLVPQEGLGRARGGSAHEAPRAGRLRRRAPRGRLRRRRRGGRADEGGVRHAARADFNAKQDEIGEPESLEDVVEQGPRVQDEFEAAVERIRGLGEPPAEIAEDADRFLEIADESQRLIGDLVEAAEDDDLQRATEIAEEGQALNDESEQIAEELGAPSCAEE